MTSSLEGRILQSMTPSPNPTPYFPSTVNIMIYHSAIQLYYRAQLMLPEGNFPSGPDLILWTLKSKKFSQAGGRKKVRGIWDLRKIFNFLLSLKEATWEGIQMASKSRESPQLRDGKEMETLALNCKELTSANSVDEPGSRFHADSSGKNSLQQTPWLLFRDTLNREPSHYLPHSDPPNCELIDRFCLSHYIYSNLLHYNKKIIIHYVRNNMVQILFINRVLIWQKFFLKLYQWI